MRERERERERGDEEIEKYDTHRDRNMIHTG